MNGFAYNILSVLTAWFGCHICFVFSLEEMIFFSSAYFLRILFVSYCTWIVLVWICKWPMLQVPLHGGWPKNFQHGRYFSVICTGSHKSWIMVGTCKYLVKLVGGFKFVTWNTIVFNVISRKIYLVIFLCSRSIFYCFY